jgi:nicotinamide riboside kinase
MIIVVTGPESTGKTFLTRYLTQYYKGTMVNEYAREYLDLNGPDYDYQDLCKIEEQQQILILEAMKSNKIVFCDTDLLTIHIWKEQKFNVIDENLSKRILELPISLYLICYPDLIWESDPLRENPNDREFLFGRYLKYISNFKKPYSIISGTPVERQSKANYFINEILK